MTTKTVLITGAAGQLGQAVAARFRQDGLRLILADRNEQALEQVFGERDNEILLPVDLLKREQVASEIAWAQSRFGSIDVCCHIAGGFRMGEAVHTTSDDTWHFLMDLNAKALLHVAAAVIPGMCQQQRGSFVTVGAGAALKGGAHMGAYSASKSALIRLTEAMSAELKHQGINVNCVLPSIIDTPDNRAAMPDADPAQWVKPQALAEVIAFLTSDGASAVHGAAIPVCGLV